MKITFIMPTYNDSGSILETISSLTAQTYEDWELIIVDDGSTDDIKKTLQSVLDQYKEKIKYVYQENQDQLNAILTGTEYITGDYIFILHSDDLLPKELFLNDTVVKIENNPQKQCFTGFLQIIDKNSELVGSRRLDLYEDKDDACVKFLLHLGRNLISDVAFFRKDFFLNQVKENYLMWNMPYWLPLDSDSDIAAIYDLKEPVLQYRVYDANYLSSELGILNVLNGELRAAAQIMRWYNIPFFEIQFACFNLLNKIGLGKKYKPIFTRGEMKSKARYIKHIIYFRLGKSYQENEYYNSILEFFRRDSERELKIADIPEAIKIYKGKDMKLFNKALLAHTLDPFYYQFMGEMRRGFGSISVQESDFSKIQDILKFFSIFGFITVCSKNKL